MKNIFGRLLAATLFLMASAPAFATSSLPLNLNFGTGVNSGTGQSLTSAMQAVQAAVNALQNANNLTNGTVSPALLPLPTATTLGGVESGAAPANQFQTGIGPTGALTFAQPAFSNLSGVASPAQGGTGVASPTGYGYFNGAGAASFSTTIPGSAIAANAITDSNVNPAAAIEASKLEFTQNGAGSFSRSLNAEMQERVKITEYTGADPTGATSSTSALNSAAGQVGGTGAVVLPNQPSGAGASYLFSTTPSIGSTELFGIGSVPTGGLPGLDYSVASTTPVWTYRELSNAGTATTASANQFSTGIYGYIPPTNSLASYEKGLLAIDVGCNDPSVLSGTTINRDCVGFYVHADDMGTNPTGSVFGGNIVVSYDSGGGGVGIGVEMDSVNNAGAAGAYGSASNRNGWSAIAMGNAESTEAFVVDGTTSVWQDGFFVRQGSTSGYPFRLAGPSFDYWNVGGTGNITQVNSGADTYHTYVLSGVQAFSEGIANATAQFTITAVQGLGSSPVFKLANNGLSTFAGAGSWTANGTVATAMSGIGPAGAHATIQEWFTVVDNAGNTRYIAAF